MTVARFPVTGTLDGAGARQRGTVSVDRETGMFSVRPFRRKRTYDMPLSVVASMVCRAIILDELRQRRTAKKAKRAGR
jgi:hypothetical protein